MTKHKAAKYVIYSLSLSIDIYIYIHLSIHLSIHPSKISISSECIYLSHLCLYLRHLRCLRYLPAGRRRAPDQDLLPRAQRRRPGCHPRLARLRDRHPTDCVPSREGPRRFASEFEAVVGLVGQREKERESGVGRDQDPGGFQVSWRP